MHFSGKNCMMAHNKKWLFPMVSKGGCTIEPTVLFFLFFQPRPHPRTTSRQYCESRISPLRVARFSPSPSRLWGPPGAPPGRSRREGCRSNGISAFCKLSQGKRQKKTGQSKISCWRREFHGPEGTATGPASRSDGPEKEAFRPAANIAVRKRKINVF